MIPCLIFQNELSYEYDDDKSHADVLPILISTLKAIRAIQRIRKDIVIAGSSQISKITIGDGTHSVASLLTGNLYKEEWRFIRGLDQASPGETSWDFDKPHAWQEVRFEGQSAEGLLWAAVTQSLVLSLALSPPWRLNEIRAELVELNDQDGGLTLTEIFVPNISSPDHAQNHENLISNYGKDESASSIIYEDDDFVARIYFFDHNPPHFHVCSTADASKTIATYAIKTNDILNGEITGRLKRIVRDWAEDHKDQLIENWARCRSGQKPLLLER
jgi:hypothetical protein